MLCPSCQGATAPACGVQPALQSWQTPHKNERGCQRDESGHFCLELKGILQGWPACWAGKAGSPQRVKGNSGCFLTPPGHGEFWWYLLQQDPWPWECLSGCNQPARSAEQHRKISRAGRAANSCTRGFELGLVKIKPFLIFARWALTRIISLIWVPMWLPKPQEKRQEKGAGMRKRIEAAPFNWCQIKEVVKQQHQLSLFGAIATQMK